MSDVAHRSEAAVAAVLPPSVRVRRDRRDGRFRRPENRWKAFPGRLARRGWVAASTGVDRGPRAPPGRRSGAPHVARRTRGPLGRGDRLGGRDRCRGDRARTADCLAERAACRSPAETAALDAFGPCRRRSIALRKASHGGRHAGSYRAFRRGRHECAPHPCRSRSPECGGAPRAQRRAPGSRPGPAAGRVRGRDRSGDAGRRPCGRRDGARLRGGAA